MKSYKSRITVPITVVDFPEDQSQAIDVAFTHEAIPAWLLDLALLDYELVDAVHIVDPTSSFRIRIELDADQRDSARFYWESEMPRVRINRRELGFWTSFFLQYYRDGMGPVDHIDVDTIRDDSNAHIDLTLTFTVPLAQPAGTPEEAERMLWPRGRDAGG